MVSPRAAAGVAIWLAGASLAGWAGAVTAQAAQRTMVRIPAGSYRPLYGPASAAGRPGRLRVAVEQFVIDVHAVTNADYLEFVRARPEWRRSRVRPIFADSGYLRHWAGDLELGADAPAASPVVNVSWFAARAYLRWAGKELPTVDQWEYVASASATRRDASRDPATLEQLRQWYGRPTPPRLPAAGAGPVNAYGVSDMHGVIWEWTLDFNSSLVTGESRADGDLERLLYCGGAAAGAADFEDYAAFMRYAFRSSLEARYTVPSLGFRGVTADPRRQR